MDGVRPLDIRIAPEGTTPQASAPSAGAASFEQVLGDAVRAASDAQKAAAAKSEAVATGAVDDIHGAMIAVKEAEISMKLVGNIRNKLVDAFHELWRTSVG
jgi:flagellar hook-basal body complex protein FliE